MTYFKAYMHLRQLVGKESALLDFARVLFHHLLVKMEFHKDFPLVLFDFALKHTEERPNPIVSPSFPMPSVDSKDCPLSKEVAQNLTAASIYDKLKFLSEEICCGCLMLAVLKTLFADQSKIVNMRLSQGLEANLDHDASKPHCGRVNSSCFKRLVKEVLQVRRYSRSMSGDIRSGQCHKRCLSHT